MGVGGRVGVGDCLYGVEGRGIGGCQKDRRCGGAGQHHAQAEPGAEVRMVLQLHTSASFHSGSVTLTRVPLPTSLSICRVLPCTAAMRWQSASPSPLPP